MTSKIVLLQPTQNEHWAEALEIVDTPRKGWIHRLPFLDHCTDAGKIMPPNHPQSDPDHDQAKGYRQDENWNPKDNQDNSN